MHCGWPAAVCLRETFVACIASLKRAGKMSEASSRPVACLDANIFLAVLVPEATRAPKDEIAGAARVLKAVEDGSLRCVSTAIVLGEIRYVYLREDKAGFEIARAAIESESNLRVLSVTATLAIHA